MEGKPSRECNFRSARVIKMSRKEKNNNEQTNKL